MSSQHLRTLVALLVCVASLCGSAIANTISVNAVDTEQIGSFGSDVQISAAPFGSAGPDQVVGSASTVLIGGANGDVEDWAFYNTSSYEVPQIDDGFGGLTNRPGNELQAGDPDAVFAPFTSASGSGISDITVMPEADFGGNNDIQFNGQGVGTVRATDLVGVIDVSAYPAGTIYFIHGGNGGDTIEITLEGVTSSITSNGQGTLVTAFDFSNLTDGILEFAYAGSDRDGSPGSRTRFQGIAINAVPEPSAGVLLGLASIVGVARRQIRG